MNKPSAEDMLKRLLDGLDPRFATLNPNILKLVFPYPNLGCRIYLRRSMSVLLDEKKRHIVKKFRTI